MRKDVNKKVLYFIIGFICILIFVVIAVFYIKYTNKYEVFNKDIVCDNSTNLKHIIAFKDYISTRINDIKCIVSNREIYVCEEKLLIGKSRKELENGYFDVKITVLEKSAKVYINKLFKEFIKREDKIFFEELYLDQLITIVDRVFDMNLNNDSKTKLFNICKSEYTNLRYRQNFDNLDNLTKNNVVLQGIKFVFSVYNNMILVSINF